MNNIMAEFLAAREELERARDNFNYAENDYFEIANDELTAAQIKCDACIKKIKKMEVSNDAFFVASSIKDYTI